MSKERKPEAECPYTTPRGQDSEAAGAQLARFSSTAHQGPPHLGMSQLSKPHPLWVSETKVGKARRRRANLAQLGAWGRGGLGVGGIAGGRKAARGYRTQGVAARIASRSLLTDQMPLSHDLSV